MRILSVSNAPQLRTRNRGISLVELMVSMVLGLLLTLGIVRIYLDSKLNYTADEEMARVQENGRFALNLLKRELTLAGFYAGDVTVDDMAPVAVTTDCTAGNWAMDPGDAIDLISDYSNSMLTTLNETLTCLTEDDTTVHVLAGTDIVSVKRTAGDFTVKNGAYLDGVTAAREAQWYLRRRNYGDEKSWLYVAAGSDFDAADIGTDTRVDYWEFHSRIFYLRDYSETVGDGIPTLCVNELVGDEMAGSCLVEGVEDMQIEFGIDSSADGVPNRFKGAPTAAELSNAVVVRIYLLLRSINELPNYTNTKTYQLGQKAVGAKNDGFYRRVMTTTVQTRNANLPLAS
jgi:hypothetical protein